MGRLSEPRAANANEVTVVVGTRPELIKTAPIIRTIRSSAALELRLVHTGQHYDDTLSDTFFETFSLPPPDVHLDIGSGTHGQQMADALIAIERDVEERAPGIVLAQGDTNAVLSTALSVSKLDPPFGHVEAGIRSFDRTMPEEVNRVVADHVSNFLFAPTDIAAANLDAEGITEGVHVTGNTVVDACLAHSEIAAAESDVLDRVGVEPDAYVAATIHRPRNTDDDDRLRRILTALDGMAFPVVLPAHPRTEAVINRIGFEPVESLRLLEPLGYLDFLQLLAQARAVVTDSGGIQEEASILEVPCLTVRPNTERPETIEAGVNELVEPERVADRLGSAFETGPEEMVGAPDLYGDGTAGERIVEIIEATLAGAR